MPTDTAPAPGSLTVPPLAGWEGIVLVLVAVLAVAIAFLVVGALAVGHRHRSPEWQAWLDGRSRIHDDAPDPAPAWPGDGVDDGAERLGAASHR